jgi:hypothetical protein
MNPKLREPLSCILVYIMFHLMPLVIPRLDNASTANPASSSRLSGITSKWAGCKHISNPNGMNLIQNRSGTQLVREVSGTRLQLMPSVTPGADDAFSALLESSQLIAGNMPTDLGAA